MRLVSLIGGNGDNIVLDGAPFRISHDEPVIFGFPEVDASVRTGISTRRRGRSQTLSTLVSFLILVDTPSVSEAREAMRRLSAALADEVWVIVDHQDGTSPTALLGHNQTIQGASLASPDRDIFTVPIEIEAIDEPHYVETIARRRAISIGVDNSQPWVGWTPSNEPTVLSNGPTPSNGSFRPDANAQVIRPAPNELGVDAWPEYVLDGPFLTLSIANLRTGKVIAWETLPLVAGDQLRIVTHPHRREVMLNGVSGYQHLARRSQLFPLRPGVNPLEIRATGGITGTTNVDVSWHDRLRQP